MLGLALLHSWVFWAACALGFCLGIGLLGWHAKKPAMLPNKKPPQNIMGTSPGIIRSTIPRRLTDQAKGLTWISLVVVFALGCAVAGPLGYFYRDHVLMSNIFTREDLDVREVYPAGNAKMQERKSGDVVYVNPCPESPLKFIPGMHVTKIRYAQMAGCKLVKYYDYDMRPDGRAQTGEIADATR